MPLAVTVGLITLGAFFVLLFLGVPVTLSMFCCGVVGSMFLLRTPTAAIYFLSDSVFGTFTGYLSSVAPMFILMGELATESKIGTDLFECFQKLTGHRRGGLASACQVVCALFGAICGSTAATGAMMSRIAYPQMKRYNYSDELSTGSIASGCCLAALIPPSMMLITYGIVAEESVGRLLMGGVITGVVLMILFIITIKIWCVVSPGVAPQAEEKIPAKEKLKAISKGGFIEIVLVFALAFGGMFAGWFTPTEAGAVGFFGMLVISLVFKRFSFPALRRALKNTMIMSGMIYCILAAANTFSRFFTLTRIPIMLGSMVTSLNLSPLLVIMLLTIIYLILGCFVDGIGLMLLTTPVFLPVVRAAGFDAVWFGCYMTVIIGLGGVTPPVGMSCYLVSGTTKVKLQTVFKGSIPFVAAYVACAIIMALIPGIATWLPNLVM